LGIISLLVGCVNIPALRVLYEACTMPAQRGINSAISPTCTSCASTVMRRGVPRFPIAMGFPLWQSIPALGGTCHGGILCFSGRGDMDRASKHRIRVAHNRDMYRRFAPFNHRPINFYALAVACCSAYDALEDAWDWVWRRFPR
jgi:hypothetical protein